MKTTIHPQWFDNCRVACACGNVFTVGASVADMKLDICGKCHPFFTGEMKFVDTMGRVERFQKKITVGQQMATVLSDKKKKKKEREEMIAKQPKSLKEMLIGLK